MKFCKYSTGDFVIRYKIIDKSHIYIKNIVLSTFLTYSY